MRSKLLSLLLVFVMLVGFLPVTAASTDPDAPSTLTLGATIRDFQADGKSFEGPIRNLETGLVEADLGSNGKPVRSSTDSETIPKDGSFDKWYQTVEGTNKELSYNLVLKKNSVGLYEIDDSSFFPINGLGFGNYGTTGKNYHFTMEVHTKFAYEEGLSFQFTGDDDLWVFVNNKRVIDLGGVHGKESGSFNVDDILDAGKKVVGDPIDLDIFFAERHTTESHFRIVTNMELYTAPKTAKLTIGIEGLGSGTVTHTVAATPIPQQTAIPVEYSYNIGTPVALVAAPAAGSVFGGWTYASAPHIVKNSDGSLSVTLEKDTEITAHFDPDYAIDFTKYVLGFAPYTAPEENDLPVSRKSRGEPQVLRKALADEFEFELWQCELLNTEPQPAALLSDEGNGTTQAIPTPISLGTKKTAAGGGVRFKVEGPGIYLLRELGDDQDLSDIPNGLLLRVNEDGSVEEYAFVMLDRMVLTDIRSYDPWEAYCDEADGFWFLPDPDYGLIVGNMQLPEFTIEKKVGTGNGQPNRDNLADLVRGQKAYYQATVTNPSNGRFLMSVEDQFESEAVQQLVKNAEDEVLLPGEVWTSGIYDRTMDANGTFTNVAKLYVSLHPQAVKVKNPDDMEKPDAIEAFGSSIGLMDDNTPVDDDVFGGSELPPWWMFRMFQFTRLVDMDDAKVTVVSPGPGPQPTPPPVTTNNTLTIAQEGQGTLLPTVGAHVHSTGSIVQMNAPVPAAGWRFDGWYGANGAEVSILGDFYRITMSGDKSIVARFVENTVPLQQEPVPEAAPAVSSEEPVVVTPAEIVVVETPEAVPLDAPVLPKTAGVPVGLVMLLGGLMTTQGILLRKRK